MVNAIPETVRIESYVRGASFVGMEKANKKVNRAFIGAALSLGTNVEIIDAPGYSPLFNDKNMCDVVEEAAKLALPDYRFTRNEVIGTGSTDMGDLSCIMPAVHPYAKGAVGTAHGSNYYVADPVAACVDSAKWQVAMLKIILGEGAVRAKQIISEFKPVFNSKEEFLSYQDSINSSGDRINYREDGYAEAKLR